MNVFLRVGVVCSALSCVSVLSAAVAEVKVTSSRELRLAIVDSSRANAAREATHQAFAVSLGAAISKACGSTVSVKAKCVSADNAAFNLSTGVYDVVLAIGNALPRPLITSDVTRLNATLGSAKKERKAYLVFSNADEGLQKVLATSFASAISDQRFLDALDGGLEKLAEAEAPKGERVAAQ